ncbi:MAG: paraquat-inducible protein A [Myxococcota bacterium]
MRELRDMVTLIGCHYCAGVVEEPWVPDGGSAVCLRCGRRLFRRSPKTVEITLALTVSAAILFVVANAYPFLAFEMQGLRSQMSLISGVLALWEQGQYVVSVLVFLTTMLAPAGQIILLLYVLAPIHFDLARPGAATAFRWVQRFQPWSMMEVFLLGVFVALVKLSDTADIMPGMALWAFILLIPSLAGALAFLDAEIVWRKIEGSQ